MNLSNYLPAARYCTQVVTQALLQRRLEPAFQTIALTERNHLTWLILFLDVARLSGRLEAYCDPATLHHIRTLLRGKPVYLSNSTGLRFLVLLSNPPRLPERVAYPNTLERNVFMLGEGCFGPILVSGLRSILVSGEPGSGKSNYLEGLALTAHRHGWRLYLADPERSTFPASWDGVVAAPVAESPAELLTLLETLQAELARRKALFQALPGSPVSNLDEYNQAASQPLPRLLLVIDEANSSFDNKAIVSSLEDLARRGRKWGAVLALAAHSWRAADVSRGLSAMLPYRVCFRVADDTSGAVALGSRHWGQQAMKLRQPGRGILNLEGRFQIFQAPHVTPEQKLALAQPLETAPLSPLEQALTAYALAHLDGKFIVNRLAAAFAGQGASHHQVQKIAGQFARRGWLTAPIHATDARSITPELAALAGQPRTGVQAVQGRTGTPSPVQGSVQEPYA